MAFQIREEKLDHSIIDVVARSSPFGKKTEPDPFAPPLKQMHSRWINNLNVKKQNLYKIIEEIRVTISINSFCVASRYLILQTVLLRAPVHISNGTQAQVFLVCMFQRDKLLIC